MNNSQELAAVRVIVRGHVQGVAFRASTEFEASRSGLTGCVGNGTDGRSVEIRAEGKKPDLAKLIEFLKVGPPGARVEEVEIEWTTYSGQYSEFLVK
jgi:acylphosphatase